MRRLIRFDEDGGRGDSNGVEAGPRKGRSAEFGVLGEFHLVPLAYLGTPPT